MAVLIIGEKPSVSSAIAQVVGASKKNKGYLEGNGYCVSWFYGHLAGLAEPDSYTDKWAGRWDCSQLPMIPENWKFKINESAKEQFGIIKKLMNDSNITEIICATDADREGECIFRYVYNLVRPDNKPVKRLWISSLEEKSIEEGLKKLRPLSDYDNLFHSGFARGKADWLVGMNCSRLFSCRYKDKLNIGRVQTPTLAMIVGRDNEVKNFVKQKYFTVDLDCGGFTLSSGKITSEHEANQILNNISGKQLTVIDTEVVKAHDNPPKLYDLTTLQREANKVFGYTAQQTLDYLQSLYEAKLATYPRSDSKFLTEDMRQTALDVTELVNKVFDFGELNSPDTGRCINNSKVSGHHAIIPTVRIGNTDIASLPEGERNILKLIANRLICACASPHEYESVKIKGQCDTYDFEASGKTVTDPGWKQFLIRKPEEIKEEMALPRLNHNEKLSFLSVKSEHFTSPPKPYTEDSLLSAMEHAGSDDFEKETEKKGLGTPATRASTIESLVKRGYAERKGKQLSATEKGINLISVVPDEVKSPKLTADWENQLLQIENGEKSPESFMKDIESFVNELCSKYSTIDSSASFVSSEASGKCPKCGADVCKGKYGYFCREKCGMNLTKLYGHELSDSQVRSLLAGKSISFTANGKKTIAEPEVVSNEYNNKVSYQWKTRKG